MEEDMPYIKWNTQCTWRSSQATCSKTMTSASIQLKCTKQDTQQKKRGLLYPCEGYCWMTPCEFLVLLYPSFSLIACICVQCVGCPQSETRVTFALVGTWHLTALRKVTARSCSVHQVIAIYSIPQSSTFFEGYPIYILSILYVMSVPDIVRANVQMR